MESSEDWKGEEGVLLDGLKTAQALNYTVCEENSTEGAEQEGPKGQRRVSLPQPQARKLLLPRVLGSRAVKLWGKSSFLTAEVGKRH